MNRALTAFVFGAAAAFAQNSVQQFNAEVPDAFGSVSGRMILAGDQLIFTSETKPESSFTIPKRDIQNVSSEGDVVTVQLRNPIRDASGERTRITVRVPEAPAQGSIGAWFNAGPPIADRGEGNGSTTESGTFQARHKKHFGGSRGRLLVTATGLAYESIDDVKDSRRWEFRDIKELKLDNPYEIEVKPFSGDDYSFALEGQGMGSASYRDLVDKVTRARAEPRK